MEIRSVVMPDTEQINQQMQSDPMLLRQLSLGLTLGEDVATAMVVFLKTLANRVGGREMNGYVLNDQWTRAAADTLKTPPTAAVLVRTKIIGVEGDIGFFDRLMTVVVPDQAVLEATLDLRHRYEEELQRLGRAESQEWAHLGDW